MFDNDVYDYMLEDPNEYEVAYYCVSCGSEIQVGEECFNFAGNAFCEDCYKKTSMSVDEDIDDGVNVLYCHCYNCGEDIYVGDDAVVLTENRTFCLKCYDEIFKEMAEEPCPF
ncbi:hypothetical protein [Candidatus Pelagibacter communis]|uniref:hypothetical protein n=2 Tax=Pelagibacter ubique TaxID=198252 RepID=UPI00094D86AC|nr:hypothetical protein [Candidatus Pelagibacter ubique]ONI47623.1 hypothetical protein AN644_04570 [Epulopiscium sp. SCG-C06WGA-EpuloA1]